MGEWLRAARVVFALGLVVVGGVAMRAGGDAAAPASSAGAQRERVRVDWSQPRHGGTVERVEIKRVTWGEFAAAADLASQFTMAPGGLPSDETEVYVVLVTGDIRPGGQYARGQTPPEYRYHVAVVDAETGKPLYEHSDPTQDRPPYYDSLRDRPDPP